MTKTMINLAAVGAVAAGLGGCAATGLTEDALTITKAECAATIAHLNATEPEFAGLVSESAGWAVYPGIFHGHSYLISYGGGDGLVYTAGSSEPTGYSRQVKLGVGLGVFGQYGDYVVFFADDASQQGFQEGGWQFSGEAVAAIYGLGAGGVMNWGAGRTTVSDPRGGGGAAIFIGIDNYSYNDLSAAMGN